MTSKVNARSPLKKTQTNDKIEDKSSKKLQSQNSTKKPSSAVNVIQGKKLQNKDVFLSLRNEFLNPFKPKKVQVEKNFLRINYLKDKQEEAAESVAQANAAIIKQYGLANPEYLGNKKTYHLTQDSPLNQIKKAGCQRDQPTSINTFTSLKQTILKNNFCKEIIEKATENDEKQNVNHPSQNSAVIDKERTFIPLIQLSASPVEEQIKLQVQISKSPIKQESNETKKIAQGQSSKKVIKDTEKKFPQNYFKVLKNDEKKEGLKITKQEEDDQMQSTNQIKNNLEETINKSKQKRRNNEKILLVEKISCSFNSSQKQDNETLKLEEGKSIELVNNNESEIGKFLYQGNYQQSSLRFFSKGENSNEIQSNQSYYNNNQKNNNSIYSLLSSVKKRASACRSSINRIDFSLDWNRKGKLLSGSRVNKTVEIMKNKFKTIIEMKEEKKRIKLIQKSQKCLKDQLYGMFSQQERQYKQLKKQEELETLEMIFNRKYSAYGNFEQIQRVNDMVAQSFEAFQSKKKEVKSEAIQKSDEEKQKKREILEKYGDEIRIKNLEKQMENEQNRISRRESQEEQQQLPWGIDQRKFEAKSVEKKEKMILKERINLKKIFSENILANREVKQKLIQKEMEEANIRNKTQDKQKGIQTGILRQFLRAQMSIEEMNLRAEERFKKITEEREKKIREILQNKENLKFNLDLLENQRLLSIKKCKIVPFNPTETMIETAFKIIDNDNMKKNHTTQEIIEQEQNITETDQKIEPNSQIVQYQNTDDNKQKNQVEIFQKSE